MGERDGEMVDLDDNIVCRNTSACVPSDLVHPNI